MTRKKTARPICFIIAALLCCLSAQTAWAKTNYAIVKEAETIEVQPEADADEVAEETENIPAELYIPVLMYHHFAVRDMGEGNGVTTSQEQFKAQLQFFKDQGYRFITLEQLDDIMNRLEREKDNPYKDNVGVGFDEKQKYICITMDDGYYSNYELAAPVLKEMRIPASIFVVTDYITDQVGIKKFTWAQAEEMVNGKYVKIYNHTADHQPLAEGNEEVFVEGVLSAEEVIKNELGQEDKLPALAFPNGRSTTECRQMLAEEGYRLLFTVDFGVVTRQTSRYSIPRIAVDSGMKGDEVLERIERGAVSTFNRERR